MKGEIKVKFEGWKRYEIYVNGKLKLSVDAKNAEMAYRSQGCWWLPSTPITIVDSETHESRTFTRRLDNAGNLLEIIQH